MCAQLSGSHAPRKIDESLYSHHAVRLDAQQWHLIIYFRASRVALHKYNVM